MSAKGSNEPSRGQRVYGRGNRRCTSLDDGDLLSRSLVVQRLLLAPRQDGHPQKHSIFKTINRKFCDIIIDGGSTENIMSRSVVSKLGFKANKHPSPYSIGWIKKGFETKVTHICRFSFSIGNYYFDEVECDVVEMDSCHIILGIPWQSNVKVVHQDNVYIFMRGGRSLLYLLGAMMHPKLQKR